MKTIAVLTDFSAGSEHAAMYALHLAKKIQANVVLYNLDPVPISGKLVLTSGLPDEDGHDFNAHPNDRLEALSTRLKSQLTETSFPGSILPEITYDNDNREVVDVMTSIVKSNDISLIVTAPGDGQGMAASMLGDHCHKIMHWSPVPVMIVPGSTLIRNPEKIAITTNLDERDTDYINALTNLVEQFSPEIMVSHLTEDRCLESTFTPLEKRLLADIYKKVSYGRIYYRRIIGGGPEKDWKWLNDNKQCDILAIRHRPQNALKKFFSRGDTMQVTHHITIPIVVLPAIG